MVSDEERGNELIKPIGSHPRLFYRTDGGGVVYLDDPKSVVRIEDVINWHDDGCVACLKNGDVCF